QILNRRRIFGSRRNIRLPRYIAQNPQCTAPSAIAQSLSLPGFHAAERRFHAPQFRQALQPAYRRVTGLRAAGEIVEDILPVIWPERNDGISPAIFLPHLLLAQQGSDYGDHIR